MNHMTVEPDESLENREAASIEEVHEDTPKRTIGAVDINMNEGQLCGGWFDMASIEASVQKYRRLSGREKAHLSILKVEMESTDEVYPALFVSDSCNAETGIFISPVRGQFIPDVESDGETQLSSYFDGNES